MSISNDNPIETPSDDRLGVDPFARAVAQSIATMEAPEGAVLAISGQWGAGKSSAVNLITHHLQPRLKSGSIDIVTFNPWWFAGADALTLSFFQQLGAAIGPSLPERFRKSLSVLGQGVSAVGAFAGALANLGLPGVGEALAKGAELAGEMSKQDRSVDQEHRRIAEALRSQDKRFLVVIDDIDRLNPDDALTIFRLVKSVGRLPNVIYLLAFDRQIAERIVTERFPSEGPSYLEKIVQRFFALPPLSPDRLRYQLAQAALGTMGEPPLRQVQRFWNVFHDVVAPTLVTPRDVVRLASHVATGWPAVAGDVDRADFLAISALELSEPSLYGRIRANPDSLCGVRDSNGVRSGNIAEEYDTMLGLGARSGRDRQRLQIAMRRLFPRLDSVWGNTWHGNDDWRRDRRLASRANFSSYFAFTASDDAAPADYVNALILNAGNRIVVRREFRNALKRKRRSTSTDAALLLDELLYFVGDFDKETIPAFVATLFELGDDLDVGEDDSRGFMGLGGNNLRLHRLLNFLVRDRFGQPQRDAIYQRAVRSASLFWLVDFAEVCLGDHEREGKSDQRPQEPVVSQRVAEEFRDLALAKIREAAGSGRLARSAKLPRILFAWRRLNALHPEEIRKWTDEQLSDDRFVVALAQLVPAESWSIGMGWDGMGDRVSQRHVSVDLDPFSDLLDCPRFEARVVELLAGTGISKSVRLSLTAFRDAPRGGPRRRRQTAKEGDGQISEGA